MEDVVFNTPEWERAINIAQNARDISISALDKTNTLAADVSYLNTIYYSEKINREIIEHLIGLADLLYSILGVNIRDADGSLREVEAVEHDLRSVNPKIIMTFRELMQF